MNGGPLDSSLESEIVQIFLEIFARAGILCNLLSGAPKWAEDSNRITKNPTIASPKFNVVVPVIRVDSGGVLQ